MSRGGEWVDPYPIQILSGGRPPQDPPSAGTGTVWAVPIGREGEWIGSWQAGEKQVAYEGTEADVDAWCRSRPALKYFSKNELVPDFRPWTEAGR